MSAPQPSSSAGVGASQEYFVRIPKEMKKRQSIMKFHANYKVDFAKISTAKLERENNLKQYKLSHEVDTGPKFGAGSEYGKDLKEEARRKKYGIYLKKYNPEDQPWLLKIGAGKEARRFKGMKEGGILDNASYFVFTQCPDGAFEAYPVEEWYNFTPQINYKCLTSEEAEEEFSRRDKTMNYFSIMVKKRLKNEEGEDVEGEEKEKSKSKSKKKGKNFMLTDMDDWADLSEEDEDENDSEVEKKESGSEDDKKKQKKKKGKRPVKKDKRKANSDDEALEESDDLDEGHEVDYMTDTDSSDEEMYANKDREDGDKYKEKGVEDEEGLKKIINSDDEEEEEKKEEEKDEEKEGGKKEDSDTESSGSSDSDSDLEKEPNVSSALLLLKKSGEKPAKAPVKQKTSGEPEETATPGGSSSRSATPTMPTKDKVAKKRKLEPDAVAAKKPKTDLPPMTSSDGINEETVRRYLMRKPMTSTDLVRKFKNTGLGKDQLVNTIAKILKRISPQSQTIKDKRFWFIKKPE